LSVSVELFIGIKTPVIGKERTNNLTVICDDVRNGLQLHIAYAASMLSTYSLQIQVIIALSFSVVSHGGKNNFFCAHL